MLITPLKKMKYCSYNEPLFTVLRYGYLPNLTFPIADLTTHSQSVGMIM